MMKLYYSKGSCSLVVRIILCELQLPCAFEAVNLHTKQTETDKNYYNINPKGTVPALQFKKGDVLTENSVILQFIADDTKSYELLPAVNDFKRYRVLEWLNYMSTELHKNFSALFNKSMPDVAKESVFVPLIHAKLTYVNAQLEDKLFLTGEHFTLADAYLFVMLYYTFHFHIALDAWPHLKQYYLRLKNRLSIQQAFNDEGIRLE